MLSRWVLTNPMRMEGEEGKGKDVWNKEGSDEGSEVQSEESNMGVK